MANTVQYLTRSLDLMRDVYDRALTEDSPTVDVPQGSFKVGLRSHQQAALFAMEQQERLLLNGLDCSGEVLYANYGILGDSVGVGKSLMILGHIARLSAIPPIQSYSTMGANSNQNLFSLKRGIFTDVSEAGSLIIVPHTLFRQWSEYIKKQTNLSSLLLDKKKAIYEENFKRDVLAAQVVLISNTLYKYFSQEMRDIHWKRVFIDEADTIHLVSGYPFPDARFTWFVTASWMPMLFPNDTLYISNALLNQVVYSQNSPYKALRPMFDEMIASGRAYNYMRHYVTSLNFYRKILNADHRLRSRLVIRCSDAFIQHSISLPPLSRINLLCKAPLTQRIVSEIVPPEVQQLLHGGDTAGAITALGVKAEDTQNLIEAVTKNLTKELDRHRKTYEYKQSLEYATPKAKEEALKSLEEKIKRAESAIASIKERIEGFKNEMCPICYDEPAEALLTPCCSRIFCGGCILTCLVRSKTCPMCRADISIKMMRKVVASDDTNAIVPSHTTEIGPKEDLEKKGDALLRLFHENPTGRFLVFSRYENPFTEMEAKIDALGVRVKQLKGNKDAIAATLRAFQKGDLRCLLLNSHYAGSGLNITAATHVVLYHAMTHEEEKQILGRAYRMGRSEPLQFIRLLHQDEMPNQG